MPTTAWDLNYVATTMSDDTTHPTTLNFVAQQDGTQITILPTDNIVAGTGVAAATKGTPKTYNLDKGQTIHFVQNAQSGNVDLSGSIIQSNFPMGLWGGHVCEVQNNPPTWRIIGAVDGTTLTYDPPNASAPATLKEGQVLEFAGPGAFHVQSQDINHPFYLAAHRPGGDCDSAHQQIPPIKALGDEYVAVGNEAANYNVGGPETVNVVPLAQFLPSYIFFTDPSYGYGRDRNHEAEGERQHVPRRDGRLRRHGHGLAGHRHVGQISIRARRSREGGFWRRQLQQRPSHGEERHPIRHHGVGL